MEEEQGRAGAEARAPPRAALMQWWASWAAGLPGWVRRRFRQEPPRFRILVPARNLAPRELPLVIAPASHFGMCSWDSGEAGARELSFGEFLSCGFLWLRDSDKLGIPRAWE